ncbi:MFS transporter [Nocardia sp. NPDC059239]|uniref:MFS transporter n=1 Tax=Nocardia sp. NPDC059239 TaxID=3346785 RepID=UPI0036BDB684
MPHRTRFAALGSKNFQLYVVGQVIATTGLWVQRIAQDWLVLSLTGSATAVGVTSALQWAPMIAFGLVGGWIADHLPRRRVLQVTQTAAGAVGATLAVLTLSHHVTAWHVQLLAAALGTIAAIEQPVRQAFVANLVDDDQLGSAVSLSFSAFYLGNFAGPAIAGLLLTSVGPGWAFVVNAIAYTAPLTALACIDSDRRRGPRSAANHETRSAPGGLRILLRRADIWRPTLMGGVFGMFTFNLPVILSTYARTAHTGAAGYAVLTSGVALGSVIGGVISAGRAGITPAALSRAGWILTCTYLLAAAMPSLWSLACALTAVGITSTQLFTATNSSVQIAAGPVLRGRALGIYLISIMGSGALGGPILGLIVQHFGTRMGFVLAGAIPVAFLLLVSLTQIATQASRCTR